MQRFSANQVGTWLVSLGRRAATQSPPSSCNEAALGPRWLCTRRPSRRSPCIRSTGSPQPLIPKEKPQQSGGHGHQGSDPADVHVECQAEQTVASEVVEANVLEAAVRADIALRAQQTTGVKRRQTGGVMGLRGGRSHGRAEVSSGTDPADGGSGHDKAVSAVESTRCAIRRPVRASSKDDSACRKGCRRCTDDSCALQRATNVCSAPGHRGAWVLARTGRIETRDTGKCARGADGAARGTATGNDTVRGKRAQAGRGACRHCVQSSRTEHDVTIARMRARPPTLRGVRPDQRKRTFQGQQRRNFRRLLLCTVRHHNKIQRISMRCGHIASTTDRSV